MKKSKKLLITSLLGAVLLTSCGEPPVVTSIEVVNVPETAVVGEVIDLKEHVVVNGNTDKFTAVVDTEDTATIEGTKLTITGDGEVSVYLTSGDQEAYFELEGLSELRSNYRELTKDVGRNYFIGQVDEYGYLSADGIIHNDSYLAYGKEYTGIGEGSGYWGYTSTQSGAFYNFETTTNSLTGATSLEVSPGQLGNLADTTMFSVFEDYPITWDDLETRSETNAYGEFEYLYAGSEVSAEFMSLAGMYSVEELFEMSAAEDPAYEEYLDCTGNIKIYLEEIGTEGTTETMVLPVVVIGLEDATGVDLGGLFSFYLGFGEEFTDIPELEAYIASGAEPTPLKSDGLVEIFDQIATGKNYTVDTFLGWRDHSTAGNPKTETPQDYIDNMWNEILPTISADIDTKVTAEGYYSEYDDGGVVAYIEDNGTVYGVSNYDDENAVTETFTKSELTWPTIWGNMDGLIDTVANDEVAFAGINIHEIVATNDGGEKITLDGAGNGAQFIVNLLSLIPGYGDDYAMICNEDVFIGGYSIAQLMLTCEISYNAEELVVDIMLAWTSDAVYHLTNRFSNFGTTTIDFDLSSIA